MYNSNNFKQFTHMAILSYGQVGWRSAVAAPVSGIDADAQAFITAASITDNTQKSAINTLVTQLKTYGIWTKLKAVYPFVGGTASSHKFNLKDPRDLDAAFRLQFNGGGTHSSTGYKGNGSNSYANTFLSPSVSLIANNIHFSFYNRTNVSEPRYDIGAVQTSPTRNVGAALSWNEAGSNRFFFAINSNEKDIVNVDPRKFFIINKTTAGSLSGFVNTTKTTYSVTDSTLPSVSMFIHSRNLNGSPDNIGTKETAFASIGDGLTDTEAANFYTAVQTFQSTLGRQVGTPIVADADAQAFINAAVITDQTQASAIDTLVTDLKSANIWTKMKAIYPFVGGTATTHKYNLKDPRDVDAAYRLTFSGGWTHSSTGALPNGTTGYANTFLTPSTSLSLNNTHISYYSRSNNSGANFAIGTGYNTFASDLQIAPRWTDDNTYYRVNSTNGGGANTGSDSRGLFIANRISNSETRNYRNSTRYVLSLTSNSLNNYSVYISSTNNSGTPWSYNNREVSFSSIGDGLTDAEAAAFYTAVQAYQTTLSRNV